MPLIKGQHNIKRNVTELLTGDIGVARRKAISTLAKKHGISFEEARRKQALIIAKSLL